MEKIVCLFVVALAGVSAISFDEQSRISNGAFAAEGQFPYVVSIQELGQQQLYTRGHRCGGVLITFQHVLTTATCTFNIVAGVPMPINPSNFRVFAGAVSLTNDANPDRLRFPVNVTVHPEYIAGPAFVNDISIITLNTPFANSTVSPLPIPAATFQPADFALCTLAGWGSLNNTSIASVQLAFTTKYIYGQNLCTSLYGAQPGTANILPSMICAASFDIISSGCTGDLGNPLVCNGGLAGLLTVSNQCLPSSFPEVYVRVSNYTEWIRSITGGASTFQPGVAILVMFTVAQLLSAKILS